MRTRSVSLAVLTAAALAGCASERVAAPRSGPSFALAGAGAKTYLVLGAGNALPAGLAAAAARAGGTITATLDSIGVAVASSDRAGFAAALAKASGVQAVAADTVLDFAPPREEGEVEADLAAAPDPVQAAALGANETFRPEQWAPDAVHAPEAWDAGYRGKGARVAILDGGIWNAHIDIAANLDVARSTSFVPGQPYNYDQKRDANGVCGATDTFWHATHVAGIVAAPANNIGTVGIAPEATLIGVKVLHCGSGSFGAIIQGIYYAATPIALGGAGADVINMSLGALVPAGGKNVAALLNALSRATSYANHLGVTVVAAAGNDYTDLDHTANLVAVPAMSVGVLAVSATGPEGWALGATDLDRPASYTNFGQSAISFAAPGGDFVLPGNALCTLPRKPAGSVTTACWVFDMVMGPTRGSGSSISTYGWAAGTSMASPVVAGVAALIVGKYGRIPPAQVAAILRRSADDLGKPGNDDYYGMGRVNAFRAVQ